ncbi:FCD domain-containing protein [Burkholderia cenocepacia]|uniref:FCD domain-containing protein n=1 Tax=Burkholderia cenocepacia TaxID=95486 RepID=UPI00158E96FA|nr:FCD domain-containing protein [Burkholderia cenocepacia]
MDVHTEIAGVGGQPQSSQTLSGDLYQRLRHDILNCRWKPGMKLRLDDLRAHYEIGLTPLREALMRLASEGLTVLEGQRGFHVSPVSRGELLDITMLRQELEALAIRKSIENGNDEWEAAVLKAFHLLAKVPKQDPSNPKLLNDEWELKHKEFHRALVAACGSPILLEMRKLLYDRGIRYRSLSVASGGFVRDDVAEHRALLEAALTRDATRAGQLIQEHVAQTCNFILSASNDPFQEGTPVLMSAQN